MATQKDLEKKIFTLEHRLKLVERFVEMRFCESFRDFSIRNLSSDAEPGKQGENFESPEKSTKRVQISVTQKTRDVISDEGNGKGEQEHEPSLVAYRTRSGRISTRLSAALLGGGGGGTPKKVTVVPQEPIKEQAISNKVLRVSISRMDVDDSSDTLSEVDTSIVKECVELEEEHEVNNLASEEDDYFTFPVRQEESSNVTERSQEVENVHIGENNSDVEDIADADWTASGGDDDNDDDEEDEDIQKKKVINEAPSTSTKRRKRVRKALDEAGRIKKKKYQYHTPSSMKLIEDGGASLQSLNSNTKECPFCHEHWKVELFDRHLHSQHLAERHLKCSYCEKRFFQRVMLQKHERSHQLDKYGKKCRLCEKAFSESYKVLAHERSCIRQRLESHQPVDPKIMEDVRQRSKLADLKWPDPNEIIPEGMKKCTQCRKLIREDLLTEHRRKVHANWKCTHCDKTYVEKSGLVKHLLTAHGKNTQTCALCKRVFETRGEIRAHNAKCQKEHRFVKGTGKQEVPEHISDGDVPERSSETNLKSDDTVVSVENNTEEPTNKGDEDM